MTAEDHAQVAEPPTAQSTSPRMVQRRGGPRRRSRTSSSGGLHTSGSRSSISSLLSHQDSHPSGSASPLSPVSVGPTSCSDESDASPTPPAPDSPGAQRGLMPNVLMSIEAAAAAAGVHQGGVPCAEQQREIAVLLRQKVQEMTQRPEEMKQDDTGNDGEQAPHDETKTAAATAALLTFVMAMLSCPLAACIPVTHLHLSRLPIGAGHSSILDALRREWTQRDFDVRLHVYQKTRHVSGVASVTPGLNPEDLDALRQRAGKYYLPLDSGEKVVVEESRRDRDANLFSKYKGMVLAGLGHEAEGLPALMPQVLPVHDSPVVYVRVMADRLQPNELLAAISDIKEEGLVYLLQRYPVPAGAFTFDATEASTLADLVRVIAPDKSAARQHMHRSHFGRAFFVECADAAAARAVIAAVQRDSVQTVDGMRFSLHVEAKKPAPARPEPDAEVEEAAASPSTEDRLFEADADKRVAGVRNLEQARAAVDVMLHQDCGCHLPEHHTQAVHSLFSFKKPARGKMYAALPRDAVALAGLPRADGADSPPVPSSELQLVTLTRCAELCPAGDGDGSAQDAESVVDVATDAGTEYSTVHQPYDEGYGFPQPVASAEGREWAPLETHGGTIQQPQHDAPRQPSQQPPVTGWMPPPPPASSHASDGWAWDATTNGWREVDRPAAAVGSYHTAGTDGMATGYCGAYGGTAPAAEPYEAGGMCGGWCPPAQQLPPSSAGCLPKGLPLAGPIVSHEPPGSTPAEWRLPPPQLPQATAKGKDQPRRPRQRARGGGRGGAAARAPPPPPPPPAAAEGGAAGGGGGGGKARLNALAPAFVPGIAPP